MSIKAEKSQQMFLRARDSIDLSDILIPNIPFESSIKLLGVTFDSKLSYNSHVYNVTKKASSKLYVLRQLKPFLPFDGLIQVYNNCIRSILEYCAPVLVSTGAANTMALERIQKRSHKIICGDSDCLCGNFIPLNYRRAIIGFNMFSSLIEDSDHPLHHLTPRRLRYSKKFCVPVCKSALRSNSYIVSMIRLYNSGFAC